MAVAPNPYVAVVWEAKAKPGREAEMRAFLTDAVTASRHDTGCVDYESHEVEGHAGTFVIFERWSSRDALEAHLHAPRMQQMLPQLLALMEGSIEDALRLLTPLRPSE